MLKTKASLYIPIAVALVVSTALPAYAIDISLQVTPMVSIPYTLGASSLGGDGTWSIGGGIALTADMAVLGVIDPYLEAGYRITPPDDVSAENNMSLINGGGGLSFVVHPITRLSMRLGGGGGVYEYLFGSETKGHSLYYSGKIELGYRFSPTFSLLGCADYSKYLTDDSSDPMFEGISAGITVKLGIDSLSTKNTGLVVTDKQAADVFPIRFYAYEKERLGTIVITNKEQGEIRDLKVFLRADNYGAREALCGSVSYLRKGASVEVPLYAAFSESVLAFTETTKVQAEVVARYKLLDAPMESKKAVALRFNHRNAMSWADPRMAAAFVSPNDSAMLELSKYLAGLVRERIRPEIDKNLQYGMGVFEGMRLSGVVWSADPSTPYSEYRNAIGELDYIQYPYQTLAYKGGDSDDVSILIAEALESVGIPSALVPLKDEMLVAFPLAANEALAKSTLGASVDCVFANGQAWVPLESSLIREGFLRAWQGGAKKWKEAEVAGMKPELIVVADAWKAYSAVGLPGIDFRPPKPVEEQVGLAFDNVLSRFVDREIEPKVRKLMAEIGSGEAAPKQLNNLGILYARYGLLDEAKAQFLKAATQTYTPRLYESRQRSLLAKRLRDRSALVRRSAQDRADEQGGDYRPRSRPLRDGRLCRGGRSFRSREDPRPGPSGALRISFIKGGRIFHQGLLRSG